MRVVVVGATGNVGTSVVRALSASSAVDEVVGIARRVPEAGALGATWREADVVHDDLVPLFSGADAVVHLAWVLHPTRRPAAMQAVNIVGSRRVFEAVAAAEVPVLVCASSVGAYSPAIDREPVDESYPTDGVATSRYSQEKAYVERMLDLFAERHPRVRTVRLRPGLIFKGESGPEIRRLFVGRAIPPRLLGSRNVPLLPDVSGLAFQAVHADDVAQAYLAAVTTEVSGAFNIAADPVLTTRMIAEVLGARELRVPAPVVRAGAAALFHLRLQRSDPGWFDLALQCPVLNCERARLELGWTARRSSTDALRELLTTLGRSRGGSTPHLRSPADAPSR